MSADEAILGEDGLVDADKAQFLSFDRVRRVYRLLGGVVGQAYHDRQKKDGVNRGFARGRQALPRAKPGNCAELPKNR